MTTLYITDQGATLTRKGSRLLVRKKGQQIGLYRLKKIERIVLWGAIRMTPALRKLLLERGIDVLFFTSHGRFLGRMTGRTSGAIEDRFKQFLLHSRDDWKLGLARAWVYAKLSNTRHLLRNLLRRRPSQEGRIVVRKLRQLMKQCHTASSIEAVRGYEGEGASLYFQVVGQLISEKDFRFSGRTRRPPRDRTNALLSLGYMLLLSRFVSRIEMFGLDVYLGALHALQNNRPSLALDMMEPFRPALVDAFVFEVIHRHRIQKEDFVVGRSPEQGPRLTDDGLKKFLRLWETRLNQPIHDIAEGQEVTWDSALTFQIRRYIRALRSETLEPLQPFEWV